MASLSDVRVKRKISCQWYINVGLSMVSAYGANPIFFNKKDTGRPEHLLIPYIWRPITSHFCFKPHLPPPLHPPSLKLTSYMYYSFWQSFWKNFGYNKIENTKNSVHNKGFRKFSKTKRRLYDEFLKTEIEISYKN